MIDYYKPSENFKWIDISHSVTVMLTDYAMFCTKKFSPNIKYFGTKFEPIKKMLKITREWHIKVTYKSSYISKPWYYITYP